MRKIILIIALTLMLTGCNDSQSSKNIKSVDSSISSIETSASSQNISSKKDISKETDLDVQNNPFNQKDFFAREAGTKVSSYDFETAYTMCVQAISEYQNARVNKKTIDFSKYIEDKKLIDYMKKKLISTNYYMLKGEVTETGLIEFDTQSENSTGFEADRLYLHMAWSNIKDGSGSSATVEFIVENLNGRLVIAEWYDDFKDTFDTICRGHLDIKKDDIYWNTADIALIDKKIAEHIAQHAGH